MNVKARQGAEIQKRLPELAANVEQPSASQAEILEPMHIRKDIGSQLLESRNDAAVQKS